MLIKSRSAKGFTNSRFLHSHGRSSGYKSSNSTKSGCSRWKQDLLVIGRIVEGQRKRSQERGGRTAQSSLRLLSNVSTSLDVEKLSLEESDVSFSETGISPTHPPFVFRGFATIFYRDCLILLFATRPTIIFPLLRSFTFHVDLFSRTRIFENFHFENVKNVYSINQK